MIRSEAWWCFGSMIGFLVSSLMGEGCRRPSTRMRPRKRTGSNLQMCLDLFTFFTFKGFAVSEALPVKTETRLGSSNFGRPWWFLSRLPLVRGPSRHQSDHGGTEAGLLSYFWWQQFAADFCIEVSTPQASIASTKTKIAWNLPKHCNLPDSYRLQAR